MITTCTLNVFNIADAQQSRRARYRALGAGNQLQPGKVLGIQNLRNSSSDDSWIAACNLPVTS